jgi:glycosyltransferase involved in cell wall biosynthesis
MKKNKHKTQFKFREAILSREKAITAHNRLLAVTGKKLFNTTGPNCSACMITWNEEEMIPYCLAFLNSIPKINEICIVDSFSTDRTPQIVEEFKSKTEKVVKFVQRQFDNFTEQRNLCSSLATNRWILYIDADETYTNNLNDLLTILDDVEGINAVRINTLVLFKDRKHFIDSNNLDPHIRIWRRGFAKFQSIIHECLIDNSGRGLHSCTDSDILNGSIIIPNLYMKHAQLLKSEKSLREKGERWETLNMIEASGQRGIEIHKDIWVEWKNGTYPLKALEKETWDITTDM